MLSTDAKYFILIKLQKVPMFIKYFMSRKNILNK